MSAKAKAQPRPAMFLAFLEPRRLFAAAAFKTTYTAVDLGHVTVTDIAGDYFVGRRETSRDRLTFAAFIGSVDDPLALKTLRPLPGYDSSFALAVRANGDVVGYSASNYAPRATLWSGGKTFDLGLGYASAINSKGVIAGSNAGDRVEIFSTSASPKVVGRKPSRTTNGGVSVTDINDDGTIVGRFQYPKYGNLYYKSFSIAGNDYSELESDDASVLAINDAGTVVGQYEHRAFSQSAEAAEPTLLDLNYDTEAHDINARGQVVGEVAGGVPVLWEKGRTTSIRDTIRNDVDSSFNDTVGISDDGRIIGTGEYFGDLKRGEDPYSARFHSYLLVPGSASLSSDGTLSINGSNEDDAVSVSLKNDRIRVSINGSLQTFRPKLVKAIHISGAAGADRLVLGSGVSSVAIDGGDGNDFISAGDASDTLNGGAGNDFMIGYGGRDYLVGGAGDDTLLGGTAVDIIDGGSGNDRSDFDRREKRISVEDLVAVAG